ncbi:MAG: glycosyl hydrolase [Steroidobacteraceae bacterium]
MARDVKPPFRLSRRRFISGTAATGVIVGLGPRARADARLAIAASGEDSLRRAFLIPPDSSKAWTYWWWLDGAASRTGITADLEAMKQQGIGGVLVFNAGGGGPLAPKGSPFMSAPWREYFRFAVREAGRLGIAMAVNLCSGWNCGGPWVTADDAIKDLAWRETIVEGPRRIDEVLARPSGRAPHADASPGNTPPEEEPAHWYRDIAVLACRESGEGVWRMEDIRDLTDMTVGGRLRWDAPGGRWTVLRLGYVVRRQANQGPIWYGATQVVKEPGVPADGGWEIDPMSAGAMDRHFAHTGAKLIEDAGPLAGKALNYFHIDSWEIGVVNWTPNLVNEFRARRGYDPTRYLPALAGKTLDTAGLTDRFTWDYRRTVADLTAENYYGRLAALCHEHGLRSESESGGPYYSQYIDALECEAVNDLPMAEFWSSRHVFKRGGKPIPNYEGVSTPFFLSTRKTFPALNYGSIRQEASAAHVYGKPINQAEAYTSFNEDWSEDPYFLKPFGDRAFCLGTTRQVLSFSVLQSTTDKPGFEWEHVGTHFDRNVTWFPLSHGWLTYLARCQHMLRQGSFVADILYFSGQAIPSFVLLDRKPIAGFDFDVINAQALLGRAAAENGRVVLPGGMRYRYFVLPEGAAEEATPAVLDRMRQLVEGGVTLVGRCPKHSLGLTGFPRSESEVEAQADVLWGTEAAESGTRRVGAGRVIWGRSLEEVIRSDRLPPDVELRGAPPGAELDWIHRRDGERDIYFLANLDERPAQIEGVFRVAGKRPELWDPVTGEVRDLPEYRCETDRTAIPLHFAPKQSWFVVFRRPGAARGGPSEARNFPTLADLATLSGPWEVGFDEEWGGPAKAIFERLEDWTQRPEEGIRYYSGMATYRKTFDAPGGAGGELYLDLGEVRNVARVRLNGKELGVVWTAPWRVTVGDAMRPKANQLEIDVVNLWPNRLIGDGLLPKEQRRTRTNVRLYDTPLPQDVELYHSDPEAAIRRTTGAPPKLLSSGLLGPVKLVVGA